jgi:transposase/transposase-like protein
MLKMGQKLEVLRMFFVEGKSMHQIASELHMSRNTIRKYIRGFTDSKKELIETGASKFELIENMVEAPKYDSSSRRATVLTDEIKVILISYIKENEFKKKNGNRKMMMTAQDMHEELIEKGYKISYPTVTQYLQKYRENETTYESFIKQIYQFGKVCEFDWGDVKLVLDGIEIKFKMAVFTLAKSNYRFAYLYPYENTQCFIDAHIRFFEHLGGIPEIMVYDNMKVAVARFVGRTEREASDSLKKISVYYGFGFRFCNIRKGNEKGHVENSVDFIRRKAFSATNTFSNIEDAQSRLFERVKKHNGIKTRPAGDMSPEELATNERKCLLPLMPTYMNFVMSTAIVDKLSTISYQQNRYSVPDYLVKKTVDVRIYADKVEIFRNGSSVAEHRRLHGNHCWSIDIMHFRNTLSRKPGALAGSVAFDQMQDALKVIFDKHFKADNKSFIELLGLVSDYGIGRISETIRMLESRKIYVSLDNIKLILTRNEDALNSRSGCVASMQLQIEDAARKHLSLYDSIIGTVGIEEVTAI